MASPLSPAQNSSLNFTTPPTTRRYEKYEVRTYTTTTHSRPGDEGADGDSSPFLTNVKDDAQENPSPSKPPRPMSRILSGTELSPLKILQDRSADEPPPQPSEIPQMPPPIRSPRKMSAPEKRFPVKISAIDATPRAKPRPQHERQMSLEEAVLHNEGLKKAIDIFEDEVSVLENADGPDAAAQAKARRDDDNNNIDTVESPRHYDDGYQPHPHLENDDDADDADGVDDTMVSHFSTFSAVPNMAMLARLGHSPGKLPGRGEPSPSRATPRAAGSGPLPNRTAHYESGGNTTNLLMDFTEQLRFNQPQAAGGTGAMATPRRSGRASPTKTGSNGATATPQRQSIVNLLDFDIPPLPTPRSIPTITPRELESLKSAFLSEISGLKATLSGKEAEVLALKTAVGDAEKRVGECAEELREARGRAELLADEREEWERRGREMEGVLRQVKEEIVRGGRERDEMEAKLDEADKRCAAAEMMAQEAESKMAGMRAGAVAAAAAAGASSPGGKVRSPGGESSASTQREVEMAVERVARELHSAYKSKHETKVAALKRSYEARWEKRVRELAARAEGLADENERLRLGRDATMTRVVPADEAERERLTAQAARDAAQIKELGAEVRKLEAVVQSVQADNADLRSLLERERVEKGELVSLAEEMMSMQSFIGPSSSSSAAAAAAAAAAATVVDERPSPPRVATTPASKRQSAPPAATENLRGSIGRTSGLKPPGSRIGRPGVSAAGSHERKQSAGGAAIASGGIPRPGSGLAVRSGIMSSIEKMGSYRGRGEPTH